MRAIQVWVPDTESPAFTAEAHRQSRAVAESSFAELDQEFIEAVTEPLDE
jgi:hypothetical protein